MFNHSLKIMQVVTITVILREREHHWAIVYNCRISTCEMFKCIVYWLAILLSPESFSNEWCPTERETVMFPLGTAFLLFGCTALQTAVGKMGLDIFYSTCLNCWSDPWITELWGRELINHVCGQGSFWKGQDAPINLDNMVHCQTAENEL